MQETAQVRANYRDVRYNRELNLWLKAALPACLLIDPGREGMTRKTNKALVLEAIEDLHNLEQTVTRVTLAEHTGLKLSIIDDRLKALVVDEKIKRVQRGVYVPVIQHPPARPISQIELPDGTVILDIGDQVTHLTPREARMLAGMLAGKAIQASQIGIGQAAAYATSELSGRLRSLERIIDSLDLPDSE